MSPLAVNRLVYGSETNQIMPLAVSPSMTLGILSEITVSLRIIPGLKV